MKKITFITGGIKSGKSNKAIELSSLYQDKAFVATAIAFDDEMTDRITKHQNDRGKDWALFEEAYNIEDTLLKIAESKNKYQVVILDCLGLWITNLLMSELEDEMILEKIKSFTQTFAKINYHLIIVSNETGMGLIPDNKLGRRFCDILGIANQQIVKKSEEAFFMVSGIPLKIK